MSTRFTTILAVSLLLILLHSATTNAAFTISLNPSEKQCYFEDLARGDRMDLSFQVSDGGNLDIDFWIEGPDSRLIHSVYHQSTATFGFNAEMEGKYKYCFSNQMSSVTYKILTFTLQGPDERSKSQSKTPDNSGVITPLETELRVLADGLRAIRDEQSYLVVREKTHRNTAESTNSRVVWWSIFQSILLAAACGFQVMYLKRFFEVKRVV